jgi:hypothetical protein
LGVGSAHATRKAQVFGVRQSFFLLYLSLWVRGQGATWASTSAALPLTLLCSSPVHLSASIPLSCLPPHFHFGPDPRFLVPLSPLIAHSVPDILFARKTPHKACEPQSPVNPTAKQAPVCRALIPAYRPLYTLCLSLKTSIHGPCSSSPSAPFLLLSHYYIHHTERTLAYAYIRLFHLGLATGRRPTPRTQTHKLQGIFIRRSPASVSAAALRWSGTRAVPVVRRTPGSGHRHTGGRTQPPPRLRIAGPCPRAARWHGTGSDPATGRSTQSPAMTKWGRGGEVVEQAGPSGVLSCFTPQMLLSPPPKLRAVLWRYLCAAVRVTECVAHGGAGEGIATHAAGRQRAAAHVTVRR